jgi:hypothetical protein
MGKQNFDEKFGQGGQVLDPMRKSRPHVEKNVGRRKKGNFARKEFMAPA